MYWDLSAAASRERGESWGGEGDSVGCVYGEEGDGGGWRVCGDKCWTVSSVRFLPGLWSWWDSFVSIESLEGWLGERQRRAGRGEGRVYVVGEEGGECVWWGRRVESVCGDEGYSAVNMFIPGLGSWWNLLACCCY